MKPISVFLMLLAMAPPTAAQEVILAAGDLARVLELEMREHGTKSVAVSSFRDLQGNVTSLGAYLAEEIHNQLASRSRNLRLVERSRTDAVFEEQRLGIDGLRAPGVGDALVQVLGVDALIVGTISQLPELGSMIRINTRLIAIPTAETIASSSVHIRSDDVPRERLPQVPPPPARGAGPIATHEVNGVTFELIRCSQEPRQIACHFVVTNNHSDRTLRLSAAEGGSQLFDQRGYQFHATRVKLADFEAERYYVEKLLITEVPVAATIIFEGVPSTIEFIKILEVNLYHQEFQLRNIPLEH